MTNIPSPTPFREGTQPRSLRVGLGDRSYDILIGSGLIAEAGAHIGKALLRPKTVIVTEERVGALYLEPLSESLRAAGVTVGSIVLPPGESTKSFGHLETLCDQLLALEVERKDMVVALGGGVIGDLVGFAAAILRRGVDFIQVPTTLLAQVDSSVGGKTGINSRLGKNLIGAFHQPRLVLADTDTLGTLDRRELLAGYAEVLKYGLLGDADFFAWLEAHGPALLGGDMAARNEAIARCCKAKADIVARDERESGERALLNLGHTFGHALEAEAGYDGRLLHGEGVAIGMAMAFYLSARLGRCGEADARRAYDQIRASGLPAHPSECGIDIRPERMLDLMRQDKKVSDGRIAFILARGVGQAYIDKDVSDQDVIAALDAYLKGKAPARA